MKKERVPLNIKISTIRTLRGITQAQLAILAGCSRRTISDVEKLNKVSPRTKSLIEAALLIEFDALEVDEAFCVLSRDWTDIAATRAAIYYLEQCNDLSADVDGRTGILSE